MKPCMPIAALALMTLPLFAHASCDAVKSDIDAKIKANGVSNYSLEVMAADQADKGDAKVVGQCEGDKVIVYARGSSQAGDGSSSSTPKENPPAKTATDAVPPPAPARSGQTGG